MVAQQRYAVFSLTISVVALSAFFLLLPVVGITRAMSAFALFATWGLSPFIFGRRREFDERDRMIHLRALQVTSGTVWITTTVGLWCIYFAHQATGTIDVQMLPLFAAFAGVGFVLFHSITLLLFYRWL